MQKGETTDIANASEAVIGILMLESNFPRIRGDVGNSETWPFPVLYKVVKGASPERVVTYKSEGLLRPFLNAAQELVELGAVGITTSCGFLASFQSELSQATGVPVASSCLMQVPWVQALLPAESCVGIVTISASNLTREQLESAGVPTDTPIIGLETGQAFSRTILNDEIELDIDQARADIISAAQTLCDQHPNIRAVVLECTNMAPYTADVAAALHLPVFDFYSFVTWFQAGLSPRRF